MYVFIRIDYELFQIGGKNSSLRHSKEITFADNINNDAAWYILSRK